LAPIFGAAVKASMWLGPWLIAIVVAKSGHMQNYFVIGTKDMRALEEALCSNGFIQIYG
jgi:hypothetical protein